MFPFEDYFFKFLRLCMAAFIPRTSVLRAHTVSSSSRFGRGPVIAVVTIFVHTEKTS